MIFLVTKFTDGAWVVVLAVPAIIFMFTRIHRYYQRAGRALGLGAVPRKPATEPTVVVVPVREVSRLAEHAISEALSISQHVIAVTVLTDVAGQDDHDRRASQLQEQWAQWDPGLPLRVLATEYASLAGPIVAFVDQLRHHRGEQIVVLIPVAVPDRLRYRFLYDHLDRVLTRALRHRPDVTTVRVPMLVQVTDGAAAEDEPPASRANARQD